MFSFKRVKTLAHFSGERSAPESLHACAAAGEAVKEALMRKIGTSAVACDVRSKDMYGRDLSKCSLPDTGDLGQWLVSNGYAVAYRSDKAFFVVVFHPFCDAQPISDAHEASTIVILLLLGTNDELLAEQRAEMSTFLVPWL
jgi:hypothetical protein